MKNHAPYVTLVLLALSILTIDLSGCAAKEAEPPTTLKPTPVGAPKVDAARQQQFRDYHKMTRKDYIATYPDSGGKPPK